VEAAVSAGSIAAAVARVETELAAFWSSPDMSDGEPVAKARASTMTFVAVGSRAEVERIEEQAEALAETHAGRSLLITVDGRLPPWEMEASWSAMCRRDGEVPICRDRVELTFGAAAAPRAASVVSALALSDVPLVVEVAPGAPTALADALADACDRLIVDSAELAPARAAELAQRGAAPIADRAFVRAFSWRELLARFYDEARGAFRSIQRIELSRTAGAGSDPAALIVGWLSSRLGWRFEARRYACDASGNSFEIALANAPLPETSPASERLAASPHRRLEGVRILAELGGAPIVLECARIPGAQGAVRWSMAGALTASHVHQLGRRDETWVLAKAIDVTEGDRVLKEALCAAAEWSAL
jgi:glucose-6-phosphate dehydrogenase assembly protein OpcA